MIRPELAFGANDDIEHTVWYVLLMNAYFVGAAITSALVCGLHLFLGGPQIAGPLLRSEMRSVPKYTNYYCWHLVTIVLAAMPIGFAIAATHAPSRELAVLMTGLAAAFSAWSLGLVLWKKQSLLLMPQWALFAPVALLGALGLWV